MKNKILKVSFIVINILLIIPSIIYLIQKGTIFGFNTYYNFFINTQTNKTTSSIIYLAIFLSIFGLYLMILKRRNMFKNIKQILIFVTIVSSIYILMLPWTSSDIFYYMGVGELDGVYHQNPYYVTMEEYYGQNKENIDDEILEQGANNFWAPTTVVYGPIAQLIFKTCSMMSFKNINVSILVYKILNIIVHIFNCYFIYKLTHRKLFSLLYGLNPYILLEFIGQVHNDVILVFFVSLSLYFLIKKKKFDVKYNIFSISNRYKIFYNITFTSNNIILF